jgi:hypothetical protein
VTDRSPILARLDDYAATRQSPQRRAWSMDELPVLRNPDVPVTEHRCEARRHARGRQPRNAPDARDRPRPSQAINLQSATCRADGRLRARSASGFVGSQGRPDVRRGDPKHLNRAGEDKCLDVPAATLACPLDKFEQVAAGPCHKEWLGVGGVAKSDNYSLPLQPLRTDRTVSWLTPSSRAMERRLSRCERSTISDQRSSGILRCLGWEAYRPEPRRRCEWSTSLG